MPEEVIDVLVEGGKATAGPPIGPALGPFGVNVIDVVNKINELTKEFQGMKVPVKITIDPTSKAFQLKVGTPPASGLILKKAQLEKAASDTTAPAGNLTMKDLVDIAKMKRGDLLGRSLKEKTKEVAGTCVSMGITIDDMHPKELIKKIDTGEFDDVFTAAGD